MTERYAYHMDEAVFDVPEGFEDRTTHALSWPGGRDANLGLIVMRRPAPKGLDAAIDADVRDMRAKLKACVVDVDEPGELGGEPARVVAVRYVRGGMSFLHRQIAVCVRARLVTLIVTGPTEQRAVLESTLEEAAASFRFRE